MSKHHQAGDGNPTVAKAWRNWLLMFIPLFVVFSVASERLGFGLVMPVLAALLVAVLVYQRLVNRRSWQSILWGVHAARD